MSFKAFDLPDQVRGDTWNFTFRFQDENGNPIDITGNEYWLTVKDNINEQDFDAEVQVGPVAPDPVEGLQGVLSIVVSAAETSNIPAKTMYYDLQEVSSFSEVSTILLGRIKVKKDVTLTADYTGTGSQVILSSISGNAIYKGTTNTDQYSGIFLDGQAGQRYNLKDSSTISFNALVVGKDTVTKESCAFNFNGAMERDGDVTKVIGGVGKFVLGKENPLFDADITADDLNEGIQVSVKAASTNLTQWSARINYTEVSF